MQQAIQKKLIIVFWLLVLLDIAGIGTAFTILHFIAKPLLMPVLWLLLLVTKPDLPQKKLLLAGLFFSWLGDILLLFDDKHPLFFIFGLACFLTTHIFYIIYFLRIVSEKKSLLIKQPVYIALVLAYGITLVWQLFPRLGNLVIPVLAYAVIICTMLLCSLHVFLKINKKAALYFLTGALAFVISDSLLAFNKFYAQHPARRTLWADQPFDYAGVFIMLTYCAAQFFIVAGYNQQHTS